MAPKALLEQFRRVSNFYFLMISAVSFIPDVSPSSPATTTLPLVVVVGFGLARDVYDDCQRKRDDSRNNARPVTIRARGAGSTRVAPRSLGNQKGLPLPDALHPDEHVVIRNRDVAVGDIVLVRKGEHFPADLLLLYSSLEGGVCYVSTANLDGESNLKRRVVPTAVHAAVPIPDKLAVLSGIVRAAPPDEGLYRFDGSLSLDGVDDPVPLHVGNVLLRGSVLRNTEFVYAMCLYAGPETKVALNMRDPPSKLGHIERMMNRVVIGMFSSLLAVTIIAAIIGGVLQTTFGEGQWFMSDELRQESGISHGLRSIGTFMILFHSFVPVSLFVTLEFVRVLQGVFLSADLKMRTGKVRVISKANNLNETLGSVEVILSDKTGTLTQNVMKHVASSTGDTLYDTRKNRRCITRAVRRDVTGIRDLVLAMGLTHSVVPERATRDSLSADHNEPMNRMEYQGESPDEVALVDAARDGGVELVERTLSGMALRVFDNAELQTYGVLQELEFSSDRKRMSVILRTPDGRVVLYSKGADSVMNRLLLTDAPVHHIDAFAADGLRTLVFARRELPRAEYEQWAAEYEAASNLLEGRAERQSALAARIERRLDFVGVTAVEDKLQDRVPETIQFLREAGIRLWVLTGDKRETAENIGYSAHLLSRGMTVVHIAVSSEEELRERLQSILDTLSKGEIPAIAIPPELLAAGDDSRPRPPPAPHHRRSQSRIEDFLSVVSMRSSLSPEERALAIIIDGASLSFVNGIELEEMFLNIADTCKTIICARVTPLQKSKVVRMVRERRNATTLAIGDGGNDVAMIQSAHVGVGLLGKEGGQAARAADYSMGEFRHLQRLITIHGRYSYVRISAVCNLSFCMCWLCIFILSRRFSFANQSPLCSPCFSPNADKNIFFTTTQILFQCFAFFSGINFHQQWMITFFNSLFTIAGPFLAGLFEKDLSEETLVRYPSIYTSNHNNRLFSLRTVAEYTLGYSLWHAGTVFFGIMFMLGGLGRIAFRNGHDSGYSMIGLAATTMVVAIVLFKFILVSHELSMPVLVGSFVSFVLLYAMVPLIVVLLKERDLEGVLSKLFSSPTYLLLLPLVFVVAFLPDFLVIMHRQRSRGRQVAALQNLEVQEARERRQLERRRRKEQTPDASL